MTNTDQLFIANEYAPVIANDNLQGNKTGVIYAANESRFIESSFQEKLTAFAVGWQDDGKLQELLDFTAPMVPTSRRFEYALATNPEEFQIDVNNDDIRAIGGAFPRVEYTSHKAIGSTKNKGLTIRVDLDNVEDIPMWRELYTAKLMRRLLRSECYRAINLLSAGATNTNKTWSTGSPNPDADMRTGTINFANIVGLHPSRILIGQTAWANRQTGFENQNVAGAFGGAPRTPDDLAQFLAVDEVFVSRERYASSASVRTQLVNNLVIIFLAMANQSPEDPSNIKRFVSMTQGGTPFRVYEQVVDMKRVDITVEHYSDIILTSASGIQQYTIS